MRRLRGWLVAACVLVIAMSLSSPAQAQKNTDLSAMSRSFEDLTARVAPAVVEIAVTAFAAPGDPAAGQGLIGRERRGGSGVLVTADGYIMTNAHVVEGARTLQVRLQAPQSLRPGASIVRPVGKRMPARLVGMDRETDLALLKIDATSLPMVPIGDSDRLRPGQIVLAFGSPLGLDNSVTMGVVSAVGRQLRPEDRMVYVQTDASINPGNSGGALVNADGELVGINTMIFSQSGGNEGIGFAAPSNIVKHVMNEIREHGRVRRGEIGVFAQTITPLLAAGLGLPATQGVILGDVEPNGPGAMAGLRVGDVVLRVNGKPLENGRQLDVNLYRAPVGGAVSLDLLRGGAELTVQVPVAERPDDPGRLADLVEPEDNLVPGLGILGVNVDERIAAFLPWKRQDGGVLVAARSGDTPTGDEGTLQSGDLIQAVNGTAVTSLEALQSALSTRKPGDPIVLQVNRRGRLMYLSFETE